MSITTISRRELIKSSALLGTGLLIGGAIRSGLGTSLAADGTPDATATRQAELDELHALQTQVANPPVCTPAPTETPEPTATQVPAVPAGTPVSYLDIWTITVIGIGPVPGGELVPAGQFLKVDMTLKHNAPDTKISPVFDFELVDATGQHYVADQTVNQELLGATIGIPVEVGVEETRSVIYDVPLDAGSLFLLESDKDPLFRVSLQMEQRG